VGIDGNPGFDWEFNLRKLGGKREVFSQERI
jgi:hypothetical protein